MASRARRRRRVVASLLVIVAAVWTAPAAGAAEATSADRVVIVVSLTPDGDARWRVAYHYHLTDETDERAFAELRADVESDPGTHAAQFADGVRPAVGAAENRTGRAMALRNVTVAVSREPIPQGADRAGVVAYRFTWEGFAAANGTHVAAGEAIAGFYLSPKTSLTLTWPVEYRLQAAVPSADERGDSRLTWQGELTFADDEPRVRLVEAGASGQAAEPATGTRDGGPLPFLLAGLAVLGLVGGLGAFALRRRGAADEPAAPTDELLSDEERVHAALEAGGGRLKQQDIAEACDWHPSKTSKVLSDMQEAGTVEVFRLGRENVVTLPEEALDAFE